MECMLLLCPAANQSDCRPCSPLSKKHQKNWNRYIDLLLSNWEDKLHLPTYYRELKAHPFCCTPGPGYSCRLNLIHEPRKEPRQFYDLTCAKDDFFTPIKCQQDNDIRCCSEKHCNVPTSEELMLLVKDSPSDLYLVAISLLTILCIILFIVSGTLYFLWRRKSDAPIGRDYIITALNCDDEGHSNSDDFLYNVAKIFLSIGCSVLIMVIKFMSNLI
uniref:Receptor protein serine/threonine kinase n=1 Tax=Schistosoma mansoni TaxID=6183 RepID=A0A3Q0KFN7_SCHMA